MKASGNVHTTLDAAPWTPVTQLLQFVPISLIAERRKNSFMPRVGRFARNTTKTF